MCLEYLAKYTSRKHPNQFPEPPLFTPFNTIEQQLSGCLSLSPCLPSQPAKETHFGLLCLQSHSFSHYPKLMTKGEGWNIDQLVNGEQRLPTQLSLCHNSLAQLLHSCLHRTYLPANVFPSYPHLCTTLLNFQSSKCTIFWQSTMASD